MGPRRRRGTRGAASPAPALDRPPTIDLPSPPPGCTPRHMHIHRAPFYVIFFSTRIILVACVLCMGRALPSAPLKACRKRDARWSPSSPPWLVGCAPIPPWDDGTHQTATRGMHCRTSAGKSKPPAGGKNRRHARSGFAPSHLPGGKLGGVCLSVHTDSDLPERRQKPRRVLLEANAVANIELFAGG